MHLSSAYKVWALWRGLYSSFNSHTILTQGTILTCLLQVKTQYLAQGTQVESGRVETEPWQPDSRAWGASTLIKGKEGCGP